ncbi:MAG TPA: FUSC family protein [Pyrinomonadaceae bacterium]|nr:FUSC family protein [Pyrinomonadaceae bacterium]
MATRFRNWLRSRLTNPVLKLSARTAVATVAAVLVAHLSGLAESYWAAIATLIVMQSALGTSLPVAGREFLGTALGVSMGAVLAGNFGRGVLTFGAGIFLLGLICGALGYAHPYLRNRLDRTAYRYAGIALIIVMLIPRPDPAWLIAVHRFSEVSIGIVVAVAMSVVWPERESPMTAALAQPKSETQKEARTGSLVWSETKPR